MAENVFILGAGASVHAGVPLMKDFFDDAVTLYTENRIDEEDRGYFELIMNTYQNSLRQIYANFNFDPELKNIETIFSFIDMAKLANKFLDFPPNKISELSIAIRRFIIRTIEKTTKIQIERDATVTSPREYWKFLDEIITELIGLRNKKNFCIITFNYDLALDFTMEWFDGPDCIDYCLQKQTYNKTFRLIKLHGSINWAVCRKKSCQNIQVIKIRDNFKVLGGQENYIEMSKKIIEMKCEKCGGKLQEIPLIVPPTWNKTGDYGIESVWHQAVKEMSEAKNIFIIGYSFPRTDLFFQYLLALGTLDILNLDKFIVVDVNHNVQEKYKEMIGNDILRKFRFMEDSFTTVISRLKEELDLPQEKSGVGII